MLHCPKGDAWSHTPPPSLHWSVSSSHPCGHGPGRLVRASYGSGASEIMAAAGDVRARVAPHAFLSLLWFPLGPDGPRGPGFATVSLIPSRSSCRDGGRRRAPVPGRASRMGVSGRTATTRRIQPGQSLRSGGYLRALPRLDEAHWLCRWPWPLQSRTLGACFEISRLFLPANPA